MGERARGAKPGASHPRARWTEAEVEQLRALHARGWTSVELAELVSEPRSKSNPLGQSRPCAARTVAKVLRGERYRDSGT